MFDQKLLLSLKEFSFLAGLSLRTTHKLIAAREVRSIRVGRRRLIPRSELEQFIRQDHSIRVSPKATLRRRPRRTPRKKASKKNRAVHKKSNRLRRAGKSRKIVRRTQHKKSVSSRPKRLADPRVLRALGYMRRERASASDAADRAGIKLKGFVSGAGRYLYRSGPGKPWKARTQDQLAASMIILTDRGPIEVIVSDSRERRILHQYELAVRMFRGDEEGAVEALREFDGISVAGHKLLTDPHSLLDLERSDLIDADAFYVEVGGRS